MKTASVGTSSRTDGSSPKAKAKAVPTPKLPPSVASSESAEERLDNLIKSLTKSEASSIASSNEFSNTSNSKKAKSAASASSADSASGSDSDHGPVKPKPHKSGATTTADSSSKATSVSAELEEGASALKRLDSNSGKPDRSAGGKAANHHADAAASGSHDSTAHHNGKATSVSVGGGGGASIIVPNNQVQHVSKPKIFIPDMKCNILKAKEQNLVALQAAAAAASASAAQQPIVCNTCHGSFHDESVHHQHADAEDDVCRAKAAAASNNNVGGTDVVTISAGSVKSNGIIPPPPPPRISPLPTRNHNNNGHLKLSDPSLAIDEFADDDDAPLLGAADTNNVTVIVVNGNGVNGDNAINERVHNGDANARQRIIEETIVVKKQQPFIGNPESEHEDLGSSEDLEESGSDEERLPSLKETSFAANDPITRSVSSQRSAQPPPIPIRTSSVPQPQPPQTEHPQEPPAHVSQPVASVPRRTVMTTEL